MDADPSPRTWSVEAHAPVRVCDLGGWTDTWFAGHGRVMNVAVEPGVTVRIGPAPSGPPVVVELPDLSDRIEWAPGRAPGRHPLVEAAVDHGLEGADLGPLSITVESAVPPGASMGTSAAVAVALLAALHRVVHGIGAEEVGRVAVAAHRLETEVLGQQSGIQDQLSAAHGGVSDIHMARYPAATVRSLAPTGAVADALADGLTVVYLGRPHDSSAVHEMVIAELEQRGGDAPALDELRSFAAIGAAAVERGDLDALAGALRDNTEAQRRLHPALVPEQADAVIDVARVAGARGWKVNGAGGQGGSLTLLSDDGPTREQVEVALLEADLGVALLPLRPSAGVRVVAAGQPPSASSASAG